MSRTNKRREALYDVFRKELTKWKETQGTVFARPLPNPEGYGLTEWEAKTLMVQLGLTPVTAAVSTSACPPPRGPEDRFSAVTAPDPPYHPPADVDNEPF